MCTNPGSVGDVMYHARSMNQQTVPLVARCHSTDSDGTQTHHLLHLSHVLAMVAVKERGDEEEGDCCVIGLLLLYVWHCYLSNTHYTSYANKTREKVYYTSLLTISIRNHTSACLPVMRGGRCEGEVEGVGGVSEAGVEEDPLHVCPQTHSHHRDLRPFVQSKTLQ